LIPLELVPGYVGPVMIRDQNIPFGHRPMHATPHALAPLLDAHLARRTPEGIGASVDWICQNIVHDIIGLDPRPVAWRRYRQRQSGKARPRASEGQIDPGRDRGRYMQSPGHTRMVSGGADQPFPKVTCLCAVQALFSSHLLHNREPSLDRRSPATRR